MASLLEAAGYRLYSTADRQRLGMIVAFRGMGIDLARIKDYLDKAQGESLALLVRRIAEINTEILQLRHRQAMVLDLLESNGILKNDHPRHIDASCATSVSAPAR